MSIEPAAGQRRDELVKLILEAGYEATDAVYMTACLHRSHAGAGKTFKKAAWGTFAWFVNEPGRIVQFHDNGVADLKMSGLSSLVSEPADEP